MELAQNQPFEGLAVDGVSFVSSIEHLEIVSEVFVSLSSKWKRSEKEKHEAHFLGQSPAGVPRSPLQVHCADMLAMRGMTRM